MHNFILSFKQTCILSLPYSLDLPWLSSPRIHISPIYKDKIITVTAPRPELGAMGTWIYDGGDLAAVVRRGAFVSSTTVAPCDSNIACSVNLSNSGHDDTFTRCTECQTHDEGICFSATADSTFSCTDCPNPQNSDRGPDGIMPLITKHEAATSQNMCSIESPAMTVSSPTAPPLKFRPTSPATLDNSAQIEEVECSSSAIKTHSNTHSLSKQLPGAKRRKSQQRRIMCVPAAAGSWNKQGGTGVPSDLWAWRKYGQKPIKGSPYPRGYYRCSSSKGCPARKQIERSHTDPTMLVITYTAEHNHTWPTQRSALARSSRQTVFHDNKVQPFSDPHTAEAKHSDIDVSTNATKQISDHIRPVDESEKQQLINHLQKTKSADNEEDEYAGQDVVFRPTQMDDHDFFADLGELPPLYPKDFTMHSDEEAASTVVDPFNFFNWSSSASIT